MIQSLYRDRRAVWLARVSRYNRLYRDRRKAWPLGVSRYNVATRPGLCCNTVEEPATRRVVAGVCAQRHGRGLLDTTERGPRQSLVCATIQPSACHDTAPCARHGLSGCAAWVQGVHLVHLTQFWTQCTVSLTVWTTVHEHYSQIFFEKIKKNKIKSNEIKSFKNEIF